MISYLKRGENLVEKVGIIAEYNPFHNGHLYHLNKVKNMFPNSYLILVLIGNFTQRADISIINKWDKTKIALEYGFDLVVELPYNIATSSASIYALGAIKILDELNCDYLVFGSETNDVEKFVENLSDKARLSTQTGIVTNLLNDILFGVHAKSKGGKVISEEEALKSI